jgi:hypothetical protein
VRVKSFVAFVLGLALMSVPGADARPAPGKVAYVQGNRGLVVYLGNHLRQPIPLPQTGAPRWSGDGRLVSFGGYIVSGHVHLPTTELVWAPTGERAAYVTKAGGVSIWTRSRVRVVVRSGWGATGVAWSMDGALAVGRAVCTGACGLPTKTAIWVWRRGALAKLLTTPGHGRPQPVAWDGARVLWWSWPNSASIAADGVPLYENARRLATTLMYGDYVDVCGRHVAVAAGGNRYATSGKRIAYDGRDVSSDPTRSWVSPSCTPGGMLVASAGRSWEENRFGREHRAIWELLPSRRRLTQPPLGWTDEFPRLLPNRDVLFVRTRQVPFRRNNEWWTATDALLDFLRKSKLQTLQKLHFSAADTSGDWLNYYGHYDWPSRLALAP